MAQTAPRWHNGGCTVELPHQFMVTYLTASTLRAHTRAIKAVLAKIPFPMFMTKYIKWHTQQNYVLASPSNTNCDCNMDSYSWKREHVEQ